MDASKLSDEELLAIMNGVPSNQKKNNVTQLSDEELLAIINQGSQPIQKPVQQPKTTAGGLLAAAGRGAAPYAALAATGAAFGGLPGAAALPAIGAAADIVVPLASWATGKNFESPTTAVKGLLDYLGVPKADAPMERIVESVSNAVANTGSLVKGGELLIKSGSTALQKIGRFLSEAPALQLGSAGAAAGAGQTVQERGGGAGAQILASLAAGTATPALMSTGKKLLQSTPETLSKFGESLKNIGKTPESDVAPLMDFKDIKFSNLESMAQSTNAGDVRAVNKIVDTLKTAYPDQYENILSAWQKSDKPLIEIFQTPITQLGETAATYPKGAAEAIKYFERKTAEAPENVRNAIKNLASPIDDFLETKIKRTQKGRENVRPIYEKAFSSTGGTAALEMPLQKQWNQYGNQIGSLRKEISKLKNEMDLTLGKESARPFNVYGQSNINKAKSETAKKIEEKQLELSQIEQERDQISSFMEKARLDKEAGKQAVWSPRLQSFLDSTDYKSLFKKGLLEQEREALKLNKKINPYDFGVTGYTEAGDPILKEVPNLKMLDTLKKGMDAKLRSPEYTLPSGELTPEGKQLRSVHEKFVGEIDRILGPNHPYALARKLSGDYITVSRAMEEGKKFFTNSNEEIKQTLKKYKSAEFSAYKDGVASAAKEKIDNILKENGNPYPLIMGTAAQKYKWRQVLGKNDFDEFYKILKGEDLLFKTKNQILGNSATVRRLQGQKNFQITGEDLIAITGGIKTLALGKITTWIKNSATGLTDDMAGSVSKILYENNPQQKALMMKKVFGDKSLTDQQKAVLKEVYLKAEEPINSLKKQLRIGATYSVLNAMPDNQEEQQ